MSMPKEHSARLIAFSEKLGGLIKEAEREGLSGFDLVDALARAIKEHPATSYRHEMRLRRLNAEAEASWREPLPWET
jgi:hypothetical protein